MADFGGFQVTTPQELLQQQQTDRQQLFTNGNVTQQRQGNIEGALNALFGNPQVRRAAVVQQRIAGATQQAQQAAQPGESDLDAELRRLKTVRDAIADVSPDTASQINQQMLKLGQVKFERARLTAQDTRDQGEYDMKKQDFENSKALKGMTGDLTYVYDPVSKSAQGFDLSNEHDTTGFVQARQKQGSVVLSPQLVAQIYMNNDDNTAKIREALSHASGSKVTAQRIEQASAGVIDQYEVADRLFQVLEKNPDVLSAASAGAKEFDKVAGQLAAAGRMANGNKLNDGSKIDDWLTANNITNSRAQSLIISLAAAQAKANNPDGRISDKDMAVAASQVGGNNPNPSVVLANLNDTLTRSTNALSERISTSDAAQEKWVQDRLSLLQTKQKTFQERMAKYATGKMPDAAGQAGLPDGGWTTLPNGVRIRAKAGQ